MTGGRVVNGINDVGWTSGELVLRSAAREAWTKSGLMCRLSPPLSFKQAHQKKTDTPPEHGAW